MFLPNHFRSNLKTELDQLETKVLPQWAGYNGFCSAVASC